MGEKYARSNCYHSGVRLAVVVALQPRGSRTQLSYDPWFRACRLRVLLQGGRATTVGLELQLGPLLCLCPAMLVGHSNADDLAFHHRRSGGVLHNWRNPERRCVDEYRASGDWRAFVRARHLLRLRLSWYRRREPICRLSPFSATSLQSALPLLDTDKDGCGNRLKRISRRQQIQHAAARDTDTERAVEHVSIGVGYRRAIVALVAVIVVILVSSSSPRVGIATVGVMLLAVFGNCRNSVPAQRVTAK
jgi:hypothetical protein